MYNLFLDDERYPVNSINYLRRINGFGELYLLEDWTIVRTLEEFQEVIQNQGLPKRISFDHDLGEEIHPSVFHLKRKQRSYRVLRPSGYDCSKWLTSYCMDNGIELSSEIKVHSANPVGAKNILGWFESYYKHLNR